jgi:hypothetical protein
MRHVRGNAVVVIMTVIIYSFVSELIFTEYIVTSLVHSVICSLVNGLL